MPRELLLMRHGKSDWGQGVPDFERPLNPRGRKACTRMGRWLVEHQLVPGRVVSSPAIRARETAERVCRVTGIAFEDVVLEASIYEADVSALVAVVSGLPETCDRALLVGHNPGFTSLVAYLCSASVLGSKPMPTAAIARIELDGRWSEAGPGAGALVSMTRPKDLTR